MPTAAQALKCFIICYDLTKMYVQIYLVRIDERTDNIVILAGEEIELEIDRNGELVDKYET
ncbi:MAG: hypothetical protein GDA48_25785 [Hormoscilla sp. GM102CHS1]|nr:hypothetical protein [Hormoscilla sp. GM102CHS1]